MTGVLIALGERLRDSRRIDAVRLWWIRRALVRSVRGTEERVRMERRKRSLAVNHLRREG
ncbi:MAG: hypothetical protein AB1752_03150 [Candidatus Zixiibacteriota bacterium]